jgi:hypothetical protein
MEPGPHLVRSANRRAEEMSVGTQLGLTPREAQPRLSTLVKKRKHVPRVDQGVMRRAKFCGPTPPLATACGFLAAVGNGREG